MSKKSRVCIAGCGYIGKQLAQRLLHNDRDLLAYVSSNASLSDCNSKGISCESINLDHPQADINLSAHRLIYLVPPPSSGRFDTRMSHFLDAIDKHPPERFVLISTTGVYGNCEGQWIDETADLNPIADRAFRRVNAEQQVQQYCQRHHIPLVILRVAGIYGPGKIPEARIRSGQAIVNQHDSPFTNRVHAHDLVTVCEKALLDDSITGVYNVTDGHPGTMYEYFTGVAEALQLPSPPAISLDQAHRQLSEGMLSYMAESRRIDNKKLLDDFELTLRYPSLREGLNSIKGS